MNKIRLGLLTLAAVLAAGAATAQEPWKPTERTVEWRNGQTVSLRSLDCSAEGKDGLTVNGTVRLLHPDDAGQDSGFPKITIVCDHIRFAPGAVLLVQPSLHLKATGTAGGTVQLVSSRGEPGDTAPDRPVDFRRGQDGAAGGSGGNGGDAETHCNLSDCEDRGAERGGGGTGGGNGEHGRNGGDADAGRGGRSASQITLWVGTFEPGASVLIKSIGGSGGKGGKGGRGWDGGNGGAGGRGGRGGDGNLLHPGKSGGNGGDGGDGGHGGDGGRGGDGGNGGSGGNIGLYVLSGGSEPAEFNFVLDGGSGGAPGIGGDPGLGGPGGSGGKAGCGGNGGSFVSLSTNSDGSCGTDGRAGRDGEDGKSGPPGVWGKDGEKGKYGRLNFGFVTPEDF